MTISTTELVWALELLKAVVPTKPVLPICGCVHFYGNELGCFLKATDLNTTISIKLECYDTTNSFFEDAPDGICFPLETVLKNMKLLPTQPVFASLNAENFILTFGSDYGNTSIAASNGIDFPTYPKITDDKQTVYIPLNELETVCIMEKFTAKGNNYQSQNIWVHFEGEKSFSMCTDSNTLATRPLKDFEAVNEFTKTIGVHFECINKLKTFIKTVKKMDKESVLTLEITEKNLFVSYYDLRICLKLTNDDSKDIIKKGKNLLATKEGQKLGVNRSSMLQILKAIPDVYKNTDGKHILLSVTENVLTFRGYGDICACKLGMRCDYKGENRELSIDTKNLEKSLKSLDTDDVTIEICKDCLLLSDYTGIQIVTMLSGLYGEEGFFNFEKRQAEFITRCEDYYFYAQRQEAKERAENDRIAGIEAAKIEAERVKTELVKQRTRDGIIDTLDISKETEALLDDFILKPTKNRMKTLYDKVHGITPSDNSIGQNIKIYQSSVTRFYLLYKNYIFSFKYDYNNYRGQTNKYDISAYSLTVPDSNGQLPNKNVCLIHLTPTGKSDSHITYGAYFYKQGVNSYYKACQSSEFEPVEMEKTFESISDMRDFLNEINAHNYDADGHFITLHAKEVAETLEPIEPIEPIETVETVETVETLETVETVKPIEYVKAWQNHIDRYELDVTQPNFMYFLCKTLMETENDYKRGCIETVIAGELKTTHGNGAALTDAKINQFLTEGITYPLGCPTGMALITDFEPATGRKFGSAHNVVVIKKTFAADASEPVHPLQSLLDDASVTIFRTNNNFSVWIYGTTEIQTELLKQFGFTHSKKRSEDVGKSAYYIAADKIGCKSASFDMTALPYEKELKKLSTLKQA